MCSKVWANEGSELDTLGGDGGARPVVIDEMDGSWRVDIVAAASAGLSAGGGGVLAKRKKIPRLNRL